MERVDLVITYVDNTDENWQRECSKYTKRPNPIFFRAGNNSLCYLLRSVDKNLPFIDRVFLIVQNKSEVPEYINQSKIRVVTHDEFIPKEYLPTFNINTILAFLSEIPDLSERFIYMDDDIFVLNELDVSDFYSEDMAITSFDKLSFKGDRPGNFESIVMNSNELILEESKIKMWNNGFAEKPHHTFRPYFKSLYKECYSKYWDKIQSGLTRFRSPLNYTCYIVDLYQRKIGREIDRLTVKNVGIYNNASDEDILSLSRSVDTICILDHFAEIDVFENKTLINLLETKFPTISKYEKKEVTDE